MLEIGDGVNNLLILGLIFLIIVIIFQRIAYRQVISMYRGFIQELHSYYSEVGELLEEEQRTEACIGLENGLTEEQVAVYDKPEFTKVQQEYIRQCFENGLSIEQVQVFANPIFDWPDMDCIARSFSYGASIEGAKILANPKLDHHGRVRLSRAYREGATIEKTREIAARLLQDGE